jgi:hypothetical protein
MASNNSISDPKNITVTIAKSASELISFLSNLHNFKHLLPQGKYSNWKASEHESSFSFMGIATFNLKIEKIIGNEIHFSTGKNSPVNLNFSIIVNEMGENKSEVQFIVNSQINSLYKSALEAPINKLITSISENLNKLK